jgi:hypothetical protein
MKRTTARESKRSIAFSSEVDTGSREENASKTRPCGRSVRVAGLRRARPEGVDGVAMIRHQLPLQTAFWRGDT